VAGPALFLLVGTGLALFFLPHPIPKTATPVQRLYLGLCAECHGANGHGSWRASLLLIRPGDLGDPRALGGATDQYVFDLIKHGGASIGKPGMPAFGFHLSDEQIRELVRYVRDLPGRTPDSRRAAADSATIGLARR
jgi:mono/diheme cytochrome c family protein